MIYSELTEEILAISGESTVAKPTMMRSVNRALRDIYTRAAFLRTVRLYSGGLVPSLYKKQIYCKGGLEINIPLDGKAYSMRLSGEGFYRITDNGISNTYQFNTGRETSMVKGLIKGGGDISFYGYASFMVFDFSVYDEINSTTLDILPDGSNFITYDIRSLYGDFFSFVGPALDGYSKPIEGSRLIDGKLEVPKEYRGEIQLTYRTLPSPLVSFDPEEDEKAEEKEAAQTVAVPKEYEHALAYLAGYYVTLVKDPIKSAALKAEYDRIMSQLDVLTYDKIDSSYELKVRWA